MRLEQSDDVRGCQPTDRSTNGFQSFHSRQRVDDRNRKAITTNSLTAKVGGYASYAVNTPWFVMLPQVQVRYLHEFLNDARTQQVEFAADILPGAQNRAYLTFTNPPDRNYLDWKASLLFQFAHGFAAFIDYRQSAGLTGISNRELTIGLRVENR